MLDNIEGVYANRLDNFKFKINNFEVSQVTFTTYIKGDNLHDFISSELDTIEKNTDLQISNLYELDHYLSLVPLNFIDRDVYEYRLKSLKQLYYISIEISCLLNEEIAKDNLEKKIEELSTLLKVSNHGPLRNLLEDKISKIKATIFPSLTLKVSDVNIVDLVNKAKSIEEINEILCELLVEDFVNIGTDGRRIVAKQFFELSKQYQLDTEIKSDLDLLIKKYMENAQNCKETKLIIENEELSKQTVNLKDLDKILH